jgi:hypothetical protein
VRDRYQNGTAVLARKVKSHLRHVAIYLRNATTRNAHEITLGRDNQITDFKRPAHASDCTDFSGAQIYNP